MKTVKRSRLLPIVGLMLSVLTWLANSSNPPTGRTGAPFDGSCNNCHSGGSFTGTVAVEGMPATVEPNTTYPLMITLTPTSGSPIRGGYQLVAVDANNVNCGNLTASNTQSGTEFAGSREYLEQRGAKNFTGGGPATWAFTWQSPGSVTGNSIKFYYIGNFCNNSGNVSGDIAFAFSTTYPFSGSPPLAASINDTDNVSCFGGNNGSATVSVSGGLMPYSFLWNNGQTAQTANNLAAGNYSVTVTGSQGSGTITAIATITQPTQIMASASANGTISCTNPNVVLTASASGGTPGYGYVWSNNVSGNQIVVSSGGTYTVTVTDNNSCTTTATATVTGTTNPPTATIAPPGTVSCSTPTVTLNASGSSSGPQFIYAWSTSNGNIVSGGTTLMPIVNTAGTYNLLVTNTSNSCTSSATAVVTQNQTLPISSIATPSNLNCSVTQLQLDGSASSQGPSITYAWTTANGNIVSGANTQTPLINEAGTYVLLVTNTMNGCTQTASTTVLESAAVTLSLQNSTNVGCFGENNGSASVLGGGGLGTMAYLWNTGDTTLTVSQLLAGNYTVTTTDDEGCTASLVVNIGQPDALLANATATGETSQGSNDGTATASPTGGSQPFSYAWSNSDSTAQIFNLTPGAYTVTITDNNGCTVSQMVNVNAFNCTLTSTISVSQVTCNGAANGAASLNTSGGSLPLVILWSNGDTTAAIANLSPGTYTASITDATNCSFVISVQLSEPSVLSANAAATSETALDANDGTATASPTGGTQPFFYIWNNGETTANIDSLPPGAYTVTISDNNGCMAVQTVNVNAFNCSLTTSATFQPISCFNGSDGQANAVVSSGTAPYVYLWSNGATTPTVSNLSAGTYSISINDASGCFVQASFEIFNPAAIISNIENVQNDVNSSQTGSIDVTISGGTGSFTYAWTKNGLAFASSEDLTGLGAGTYQLMATDGNGCTLVVAPVVVDNTVASSEPGKEDIRLKLWPNPAPDLINVSWNSNLQPAYVRMVDVRGQWALELTPDQLAQPILVQLLPTGLYTLQVVFTNGSVSAIHWMKSE